MGIFNKRAETDLDREIAHHLHHLAAEYERQGHSKDEALRLARRDFGGPAQIKEECRDERRFAWLTGFRQDIVFGFRMMRRAQVVTIAAVLSLALGIGANAAIASLMDIVLWRSLPVPTPQQLRLVNWQGHGFPRELAEGAWGGMEKDGAVDVADFFAYSTFEKIRKEFEGRVSIAAYSFPSQVSVAYHGHPAIARERPVGGNFFGTIQVNAAMGRVLADFDDRDSAPDVIVLTHRFWQRELHGDPNVVGQSLVVDNRPHVIAGVLPASFYGLSPGDETDLYSTVHHSAARRDAIRHQGDPLANPRVWCIQMIARLAAGVDAHQIEPVMDSVFRSTWLATPKEPAKAPRLRLDDGSRGLGDVSRAFRSPLLVLGSLVALLLIIACANIANLLLARAVARRKEIAMRMSLGCSRGRLIRQFLTESAIIAVLGGAASLAVAYVTGNLLGTFIADRDRLPLSITLDPRTLALVAGFTIAALMIFGALPAWSGSRGLDATWLKQGAGSVGTVRTRRWNAGRLLVVAQMAMSVVLVMAAVIFTRNLRALESTDPGFDRRNLVIFDLRPGTSGYEPERLQQFYFNLEQRLASTSGVANFGLIAFRPMNVGGWWETGHLKGGTENLDASMNGITPGYLPMLRPELVAGRNFTWSDINNDAKVAIISEDMAKKLGGPSVLGRQLVFAENPKDEARNTYEIVGIAPTIAPTSIKTRPYAVWVPLPKQSRSLTVVIRTGIHPAVALGAIRQTMNGIDPNLPLVDVTTMEEQISKVLQRERMFATLCGGFGILALVLSVVGLYGVMAYTTSRRRTEIGLRLALGARPTDVLTMIVREGLILAGIGVALGLPIIYFGAKYVDSELYKMKALESGSVFYALAILLTAAVAAIATPAIRAAALEPSQTLREE